MAKPFDVIDMPSSEEFVADHISQNRPVVVRGLDYDPAEWHPDALTQRIGDLTALVYGSLFELDDVQTLQDYIETWFGSQDEMEPDTPYVRWYNKLRDVEFAWGDAAFERVASAWRKPACLPTNEMIVPVSKASAGTNPVTDAFPYRGLLVAARGARTRMHRDPFYSDAVVCQFYGSKEAALYRPERATELTRASGGTSFGGFVDVRENDLENLSVEPDFHGTVGPGEMIYIPNGWLHDVIAVEDSVSITWNFVHKSGAGAFSNYLKSDWDGDPEFEILQYFHRATGSEGLRASEIVELHGLSAS